MDNIPIYMESNPLLGLMIHDEEYTNSPLKSEGPEVGRDRQILFMYLSSMGYLTTLFHPYSLFLLERFSVTFFIIFNFLPLGIPPL